MQLLEGGDTLLQNSYKTSREAILSYTVKENHIGSSVRQIDADIVTFINTPNQCIPVCWVEKIFLPVFYIMVHFR